MGALAFWMLVPISTLWAGTALWMQFASPLRLICVAVVALAFVAIVALRLTQGWAWSLWLALMVAVVVWYATLTPRDDRAWAADVTRIVQGRIEGDIAHLQNIRDFNWISADQADRQIWHSRSYDLTQLEGADMITSVWGNPKIAHLLVSFRFTDQAPLTFSIEIRREAGESFSALGGFFRQFEQSLIAATEEDILQWRAGPRGEDVRLYPLTLPQPQLRELFEGFVAFGNDLNRAPQWYNTLTANCTTVVWQLARAADLSVPIHPSLLLSGLLPDYLDRFGVLAGAGDLDAKRARARLNLAKGQGLQGAAFSKAIRSADE